MAIATGADGTTIHYEDHGGTGTNVVLVHGITESSETWRPITDRLIGKHRVVTLDLRGHGQSGTADRYDLEAMAGDVVTVITAIGMETPHIVGHSLGGAVVSAVGAAFPVASIVNVDQSLQLGSFKEQLSAVEAQLRDPEMFPLVIEGLFGQLAGPLAGTDEFARVNDARRPDQDVVLGVWEMIFAMSEDDIAAVVEGALAGYAGSAVPYLSLFGIDPGPEYATWLSAHIATATVEVWADQGHYPHLANPDKFVTRLEEFWYD
ncbi:MAG: alpha/beta hydrolase [Actinobacteria bacterium]|nr:alpha/beta hydrolase [Actinomycetota bacterium]